MVYVILTEHPQRRRGEPHCGPNHHSCIWRAPLKFISVALFCSPTCGPPPFPIFLGGTSCVLCFLCLSAFSSIWVVEDICALMLHVSLLAFVFMCLCLCNWARVNFCCQFGWLETGPRLAVISWAAWAGLTARPTMIYGGDFVGDQHNFIFRPN